MRSLVSENSAALAGKIKAIDGVIRVKTLEKV
jgi:hypothetical protein